MVPYLKTDTQAAFSLAQFHMPPFLKKSLLNEMDGAPYRIDRSVLEFEHSALICRLVYIILHDELSSLHHFHSLFHARLSYMVDLLLLHQKKMLQIYLKHL